MVKLWQITRVPPRIALNKLFSLIKRKLFPLKEEDFFQRYYSEVASPPFSSLLTGYFKLPELEYFQQREEIVKFVGNQLLQHKFNLLGTGWICRNHNKSKVEIIEILPGFWKNKAYQLLELINDYDYQLIDFWSDPKTSYVWKPNFFKKIPLFLGSDIKNVWEIGRMQHLPFLAYCYYYWKFYNIEYAEKFANEFQNEILDFIATNPVGYTVQWKSSMDVSIRLSNWLVAYDLFKCAGFEFNGEFNSIFFDSIYKHILFVIENLEWSEGLRGNHYFANIVSLVFAGVYLPISDFSTNILAFGINELVNETLYQFYPDGGNFEASTYYHIQVVEMLCLAMYLLYLLNSTKLFSINQFLKNFKKIKIGNLERRKIYFKIDLKENILSFSSLFLERFYNIVKFTQILRKKNGNFEQIGDNDSGYFLRLDYFFESENYYGELFPNVLKRFMLWDLLDNLSYKETSNLFFLDHRGKGRINFPPNEIVIYPKLYSFPHFGLYIIKSNNYEMFVRCGNIGQKGKGGHSHNDQLSFTLNVNGKDFIVDPGLFCYSCSEKERNKFRSVHSHNTLVLEGLEQNVWKTGDVENLFWISKHRTKSKVISIKDNCLKLVHFAYRKPHHRTILFDYSKVVLKDSYKSDKQKALLFHLHPSVGIRMSKEGLVLVNDGILVRLLNQDCELEILNYDYSPQYGVKVLSKKLVYTTTQEQILTILEII
ncbi:MAG: heparinase II/III family protein [Ignavibacteria bacterium]|nr:heparinase II/III family protein [Ignavibacteria bacterium]